MLEFKIASAGRVIPLTNTQIQVNEEKKVVAENSKRKCGNEKECERFHGPNDSASKCRLFHKISEADTPEQQYIYIVDIELNAWKK